MEEIGKGNGGTGSPKPGTGSQKLSNSSNVVVSEDKANLQVVQVMQIRTENVDLDMVIHIDGRWRRVVDVDVDPTNAGPDIPVRGLPDLDPDRYRAVAVTHDRRIWRESPTSWATQPEPAIRVYVLNIDDLYDVQVNVPAFGEL